MLSVASCTAKSGCITEEEEQRHKADATNAGGESTVRKQSDEAGCREDYEAEGFTGAGRGSAVPEDVYQDWLRWASAGFSRGVLSLFEPGADHPPAR